MERADFLVTLLLQFFENPLHLYYLYLSRHGMSVDKKQASLTPLMRQYFDIKSKYPGTLLLFQVGDFYEIFFEDAQKAAGVLGIALTQRGTHNGDPIPLCGVPLHVVDHYMSKLVRAGFKVALCDQLENRAQER